jgi:hypothetical protein
MKTGGWKLLERSQRLTVGLSIWRVTAMMTAAVDVTVTAASLSAPARNSLRADGDEDEVAIDSGRRQRGAL